MIIKILGMKGTKCTQLKELVMQVLKELGVNVAIEEINELNKMLKYPIFNSPALVIGEKVVCSGEVPSKDEMKNLVKEAIDK